MLAAPPLSEHFPPTLKHPRSPLPIFSVSARARLPSTSRQKVMAQHKPPFTLETAHQKVKAAQGLWNTRDPSKVAQAYTPGSVWRNRSTFLCGTAEIEDFLTKKWEREKEYRLRKELFAQQENRIAVQFWYEYRDAHDSMVLKRCYGIEHWTFAADGKMEKRMMSGNDVVIGEEGRWFKDGVDVDSVTLGEKDF